MENWLLLGLCALISAFLSLIVAFIVVRLTGMRLEKIIETTNDYAASLDARLGALEGAIQHEDLSQRGKKGVEVREQNKEMRAAAMNEGRQVMATLPADILTNPAAQDKVKQQLALLAQKYPKVANEVSDGLFSEFHIEEPFKGIIKGVIANALMNPASATTPAKENWYGIEV